MKNYVQGEDVLDLVAPTGGVVSGKGYLIGAIFVVAMVSAAEGETFAGQGTGVIDLDAATHATTQAIVAGGPVYWDATAGLATKTATGNTLIGACVADKASTASSVKTRLWRRAAAPVAAITNVATTGATNTTPYGFTTAAQADALVADVNLILAAMRLAGIVTP